MNLPNATKVKTAQATEGYCVWQEDAAGWERWVYLFAQLRQLPVLAPHIPTKEPRLRQTAYEMVLHAFLLSPADHPRLLDALHRWPPDLYSIPSLTQSVIQRSGATSLACST